MAYRSPWTTISELALGLGETLNQAVGNYQQRMAYNGQAAQTQVQEYVGQAETALADANYQWKPGEREAAEAFITQAKQITAADPTQAAGMWADLQKRGIKIPSTAIKQSAAGQGMTEEKTLTPYEGGISGFFGDVNSGVAAAGQERAQFEEDLEMARTLQINGQQVQANQKLEQMRQRYGAEMLENEQVFAAEQTAAQMDVAASATATDRTIATLKGLISTGKPKDRQIAEGIMKRMEKAGLQDYDWATLQGEFAALGSTSAEMDYSSKNQQLFQTELTTENMTLQNDLSRQSIKIGNQTFRLGELQINNEEWLARRREGEAALADTAAVQSMLGTAYAQGDTGFINERIRILEDGDETNPQYQALVAAGITAEGLENKLTTMEGDEAFRLREQALQDELITEEYNNIFFRGEGNRQNLFDTLAKRYSPDELHGMMADESSPLGKLVKSGDLTDADMRALDRSANAYRALEVEEVIAPKVERAYKNLEIYSALPANREKGLNALNATLGTLIDNGVLSPEEAEGYLTTYQESWDYQERVANDELATSASKRLYAKAQAQLMRGKVQQLNAKDDPLDGTMTPDQERFYNAQRGTITDVIAAIEDEGEPLGCGFSPDGMTRLTDNPTCVALSQEIRAERAKLLELGATLRPGGFDVQGRVVELADRIGTGVATPQEQREFETLERTMGEDTIAGILGVPTPAEAAAQAQEQAQANPATPAEPRTLRGDAGAVVGSVANAGRGLARGANAFQDYVLGNNAGTAQAAPAPTRSAPWTPNESTIDPSIERDLSYRKLLEGGLTPEQEVAEFESLHQRYGVPVSDIARYLQTQRGR